MDDRWRFHPERPVLRQYTLEYAFNGGLQHKLGTGAADPGRSFWFEKVWQEYQGKKIFTNEPEKQSGR